MRGVEGERREINAIVFVHCLGPTAAGATSATGRPMLLRHVDQHLGPSDRTMYAHTRSRDRIPYWHVGCEMLLAQSTGPICCVSPGGSIGPPDVKNPHLRLWIYCIIDLLVHWCIDLLVPRFTGLVILILVGFVA